MENYEVIETIGVGSFGKVCKIVRKSDSKVLVWKEMNYGKMKEKEKQQLVSEVNILRELRHPNIVRYYDRQIDKTNQKIYIIMEYCDGGVLLAVLRKLKKEKEFMAEDQIWRLFMQVILALHEIHRRKEGVILHRDIKPANIFLDSAGNAKLGDFGLSKMLGEESVFAYTHVGTPYYMSPEQINEHKYNEKSDIWSTGCLLYEMCNLAPPFEASNHLALAMKIKNGKIEKIHSRYSEELQRVIKWCLNKSPEDRPSVDDLLNLPQVSIRLREKRLRDNQSVLKKREEECRRREESLNRKEEALRSKEEELRKHEEALLEQERSLDQEVRRSTTANTSASFTTTCTSTPSQGAPLNFTNFKSGRFFNKMFEEPAIGGKVAPKRVRMLKSMQDENSFGEANLITNNPAERVSTQCDSFTTGRLSGEERDSSLLRERIPQNTAPLYSFRDKDRSSAAKRKL